MTHARSQCWSIIESVIETAEFPLKFASWTGLQLQLPFPEADGGGVVKLE